MTPTLYLKLFIRNYRRRKIRKVLSNEFTWFLNLLYKYKFNNFNFYNYILFRLIPYNQVRLSYIFVIFFKIASLYILIIMFKDMFRFIKDMIWLFRLFLWKQWLLYWYIGIMDWENLAVKYRIRRGYVQDAEKKYTYLHYAIHNVNVFIRETCSLSSIHKLEPEFYMKRNKDWELFVEKVKNEMKEWRQEAVFHFTKINSARYQNLWNFKYKPIIDKKKFFLLKPLRRIIYKYLDKFLNIIITIMWFIYIKLYSIYRIIYFFLFGLKYSELRIQNFNKEYKYLKWKYGTHYNFFVLEFLDKINNIDENIIENEIKVLTYSRVINEKKYLDNLKGKNVFFSFYFYVYLFLHKIHFYRNHYLVYIEELENVLKKKYFPNENFNISFELKFKRFMEKSLIRVIKIYPYIFKFFWFLSYLFWILNLVFEFFSKIYIKPIFFYFFYKIKKIFIVVYNIPIGLLKYIYVKIKIFFKIMYRTYRILWNILRNL